MNDAINISTNIHTWTKERNSISEYLFGLYIYIYIYIDNVEFFKKYSSQTYRVKELTDYLPKKFRI
jgi:hypothetical protein